MEFLGHTKFQTVIFAVNVESHLRRMLRILVNLVLGALKGDLVVLLLWTRKGHAYSTVLTT